MTSNLKDIVKDMFEKKQKVLELQSELKYELIPRTLKILLDNNMTSYFRLDYPKLYKDFIHNK